MKKKISLKLAAMTLLLIVSVTTVAVASFAWLSLSDNPTASGIQISLSGGNTILIAPDLSQTVNGTTLHYPGEFSETLDFSGNENYAYLNTLGGLSPVSTADGLHWFLPTYYTADDPLVQAGFASAGTLRPVQDFLHDDTLTYANQTAESENLSAGHYVYLDFWVVSPGTDYYLRISTGSDSGSYVIDLPQIVPSDNENFSYTLSDDGVTSTAASVRVGFLASTQTVTDESILAYQQTAAYDKRFASLRGVYGAQAQETANRFLIYEPNADAHPNGAAQDGSYVATRPLASVGGVATPISVQESTAVQATSRWKTTSDGGDLLIRQEFQTGLFHKDNQETLANNFYTSYLHVLGSYINKGAFVRNCAELSDTVTAEYFETLEKANATQDVYIVALERNVPQRIRMFVWIEGQDIDWNPAKAGERFALSVELAGSDE